MTRVETSLQCAVRRAIVRGSGTWRLRRYPVHGKPICCPVHDPGLCSAINVNRERAPLTAILVSGIVSVIGMSGFPQRWKDWQ